jgi:hypothetical protein
MQLVDRSVVPRQLVMMSDEELRWITQMATATNAAEKDLLALISGHLLGVSSHQHRH